jgi:hypothetical protein
MEQLAQCAHGVVQSGQKSVFGALSSVLHRAFRSLFHRICEKPERRSAADLPIGRKRHEYWRLALAPIDFIGRLPQIASADFALSWVAGIQGLRGKMTAREAVLPIGPLNRAAMNGRIMEVRIRFG